MPRRALPLSNLVHISGLDFDPSDIAYTERDVNFIDPEHGVLEHAFILHLKSSKAPLVFAGESAAQLRAFFAQRVKNVVDLIGSVD